MSKKHSGRRNKGKYSSGKVTQNEISKAMDEELAADNTQSEEIAEEEQNVSDVAEKAEQTPQIDEDEVKAEAYQEESDTTEQYEEPYEGAYPEYDAATEFEMISDESVEYEQDMLVGNTGIMKPLDLDGEYFGDYESETDLDFLSIDEEEPESDEYTERRRNNSRQKTKNQKKKAQKNSGWNAFNKRMSDFVFWIKKNKRLVYSVLATVFFLVLVIVVIGLINKDKNKQGSGDISDVVSGNMTVSADGTLIVSEQELLLNEYPEVNAYVQQYLDARAGNDIATLAQMDEHISDIDLLKITMTSWYIEGYNNLECYTKAGPYENSYIVYAAYSLKLYEWDTEAPGLITLLVCTDDAGQLYIYSGELDANVAEYITQISSQSDVTDLVAKVDANYHEVLDENIELAQYISDVNSNIKSAVADYLASTAMDGEEDGSSESANEADLMITFEVKVTDTVNVRASDSENADRIDQVAAGTILDCYEQMDNGWSKVDYHGEIAYISSQYLERLDFEEVDESLAIGTVKIKETVNIRAGANTSANILGVGYSGETYSKLAEDSGGWTKIIYNGREAYVNSSYIE